MARDLFHENVKKALQAEGWMITDDPLTFKIGKVQVQIDLGGRTTDSGRNGDFILRFQKVSSTAFSKKR